MRGVIMLWYWNIFFLILFFYPAILQGGDFKQEQAIENLISQMTLQEKIDLLGGTGFATKAIPRLGIPELKMTDGPLGVRWNEATAFPSAAAMAASWNPELLYQIGVKLAEETKAKGRNMLLGPCINIVRVPHGGRNFETFGEDPYLTSRLAVAYIQGVQSQQVAACVKHYACNNQENERMTISAEVDERTLREIYLPGFHAAVTEAKSRAVMAAYNKVNGFYCTENDFLQNRILKGEWGFDGLIVSDWGATHHTIEPALNGLDLEMPTGQFFNEDLLEAVQLNKIPLSIIDDKVRRILRVMYDIGLFDATSQKDEGALHSPEHQQTALDAAREGIVLLKNERNVLPLKAVNLQSIAVIGPNAAENRCGGGGSSRVEPVYSITALQALQKRLVGSGVQINYAMGCRLEGDVATIPAEFLFHGDKENRSPGLLGEYFTNMELKGTPVVTRVDEQINFSWGGNSPATNIEGDLFSVRWTGSLIPKVSGIYKIGLASDDGVRMWIDGKLLVDDWRDHALEYHGVKIELEAAKVYSIKIEFYENSGAAEVKLGWELPGKDPLQEALQAARTSDVALVFAGLSEYFESEGFDRSALELPADQVQLINEVARLNNNTVVVLNSGAPLLMDEWLDEVPALLQLWYPGQEGGNAIADVLLGDYNPNGKLPVTFPQKWEDCAAYGNYPGTDGKVHYAEGIFVGYRHFDHKNITPLFPFGFGLSYTAFSIGEPQLSSATISEKDTIQLTCAVTNTGNLAGAEVVQLYVQDVTVSVPRPPKELKGFQKVWLLPGETRTIKFNLKPADLAFYDIDSKSWKVEPGEFQVLLGNSSQRETLKSALFWVEK